MTKHHYTKGLDIPQDANSVRYPIPEGYTARLEDGVLIIESEESEDERIRRWLFDKFNAKNEKFVEELDNYRGLVTREQILTYLEKQKEQKQTETKGKEYLRGILDGKCLVLEHPEKYDLYECAEWSKEDEAIYDSIIREIVDKDMAMTNLQKRWLRSLKNRGNSPKSNTNSLWKPSKEELEFLSSTIDVLRKGGHAFFAENLESIRERLRKLI